MNDNFKILGLDENVSEEEVELAYNKLKDKYSRERFYEGEIGNEAAKKLNQIETAYSEIKNEFKLKDNFKADFNSIESLIKDGFFDKAQEELDNVSERNAEWHYLQSVIFYKKSWLNESKKQLEIALDLDPNNEKYKNSYQKLSDKINFNQNQFHSGNFNANPNNGANRQMGNDCGACIECCAMNMCLNCMCNGCCR